MLRVLRALLDGLLLRCPRCHTGRMFTSWFHMRRACPVCGMPFERASGEITGGMGVNIVATLALVIVAAAAIGFSSVPLLPAFLVMGALVVLFPIAFYPSSRGLWVGVLYLTGDNAERD
ncbi:MAG TPA: DUF983 domain-containing protein [Roseiflexaceae bacterium]|nr:DUF983 domain-containing protein [Roseiflexaceae bacterium]